MSSFFSNLSSDLGQIKRGLASISLLSQSLHLV
ncbi:unnamed protein product [Nezara viridula]|uniref:Uncharacterized protein n=1 Tax=Nezara viridula TaxID=85310 RepID=A0A9P0H970_NEZVI|nr:unnamed protein product [Nezara viridula]